MRRYTQVSLKISWSKLDALEKLIIRILPTMESEEETLLKECYVDLLQFITPKLQYEQRNYKIALTSVRAVALMKIVEYNAEFTAYEGIIIREIIQSIDKFKKNIKVRDRL